MTNASETMKGERTMSQGFIAQYAMEAALRTDGVASLDEGAAAALKEAFGYFHEGQGVRVRFGETSRASCAITIYPIIYFGSVVPEVAWNIQEHVKSDVEKYTGIAVDSVDVHVKGITTREARTSDEEDVDALD